MFPLPRGAVWQALFLLSAMLLINEGRSEGRVVCYYTNWSVYRPGTAKFNPQNINPYLCTHLVYAFGGFTKDNQMKPFDKYQDVEQGGYAKFTGLKTYNKQLKTMIAIGGWNEASSRFSPLVASADRRQKFIKNILKFLRQNHFDGIDLDWEYPAHREGGKTRDRENYAQFVQELRAEFERESEKTGRPRLLLTMAVPAGIEYIEKGYDIPKLNKYLDWFNVLTYDFHSSHEPSVNHHAPLYSLEEESEYNYDTELNIDYAIKFYLNAGAERDKLVLGIPTYGRSFTLINEESTEIGAPSEGPGEQGEATREKGYLAYYEICENLKADSEWTVVQLNANAMGPYAYRRNQWVGYDDEAIVRKKAEYVVENGLGGIMFWAIDNDDFRGTCTGKPYPLIEAAKGAMLERLGLGINEVANHGSPKKPLRSRSRDSSTSTRNRITSRNYEKPEVNERHGSSSTARTTTSPPSTTIKLTAAEGSSLYIGGRTSTPPPPSTPDPGADFKCEEEGFFQHPRDCKKYFWCLDSGPSGLGIVAHQFTCPSGLYFNPSADSCDFARNVPCKTKKSTTTVPVTFTTTTTTARPTTASNRITAAPTRNVFFRTTKPTTTSTTTSTTTTTTAASIHYEDEYEDEADVSGGNKNKDSEEDPKVLKELIDLIRKVGGIEELEKHLLRKEDGTISIKENSSNGISTTASPISKSLYDKVLSRPNTYNSFRNRLTSSTLLRNSGHSEADKSASSVRTQHSEHMESGTIQGNSGNSRYSSVVRGNSRQGPQNEGLDKLPELEGLLKERKEYVTINRNRSQARTQSDTSEEEERAEDEERESHVPNGDEDGEKSAENGKTSAKPVTAISTLAYTSIRRNKQTTKSPIEEKDEVATQDDGNQVKEIVEKKAYTALNRARGRSTTTTTESSEPSEEFSSTTTRYKFVGRPRPTKSSLSSPTKISQDETVVSEEDTEEIGKNVDDEQENVMIQLKAEYDSTQRTTQTTAQRTYASTGRRTTATASPSQDNPSPTIPIETATMQTKLLETNEIPEPLSTDTASSTISTKVTPTNPITTSISLANHLNIPSSTSNSITSTVSETVDLSTSIPTTSKANSEDFQSLSFDINSLVHEPIVKTASTTESAYQTTTDAEDIKTTIKTLTTTITTTDDIDSPPENELRTPTATLIVASRRPVLSVRRRIANSPATPATETTNNSATDLTTPVIQTTTNSKFHRLRSRPETFASATSATSSPPATTVATHTATVFKNYNHKNYLSTKLKTSKSPIAATAANVQSGAPSLLAPSTALAASTNDVTQHLAPASSNALRRKFQTRRFSTTTTSANAIDTATDMPRTQNPLFKRRFPLTTTASSPLSTTATSAHAFRTLTTASNDLPSTTLYQYAHIADEATDQIAKSSIHTSRFNKILGGDEEEDDDSHLLSALSAMAKATTRPLHINLEEALAKRPATTITSAAPTTTTPVQITTRRPPKTRGSQPQKDTPIAVAQQAAVKRQRSHKYAENEPFNRLVSNSQPPNRKTAQQRADDYDYYDDEDLPVVGKSQGQLKVILHGRGIIECLDQGNFPHPLSCRKFISCAKFETGGVVGWEYTCPKGLSYDPVGGMCNWAAGLGCKE